METIKDRLIKFLAHLEIGQGKFEKNCGISNGSVNNIKEGGITTQKVEKILAAYPELNVDWLITGNGNMLKQAGGLPAVNYERKGSPYYNVDFIGGFDILVNDQTRTPDYYIDFEPYNRNGVIWCNISGHSMEPEINNGDFIALRKIEDWQNYLTMGEIYAIVTTNGLRTVKRVRKGGTPDSYTLVPSNKDYDEQEIEKRMIMTIFEVMGGVKRF